MSGALVPVAAPAAPALTNTEKFVARVQQSNPAYKFGDVARAQGGAVVPITTAADPTGNIAKFDAEQVKAGRQMTGEQATRNQAAVQKFQDETAFAKALTPHINAEGFVDSKIMNSCKPLLSGYTLPPGIEVHAASVYRMFAICRKAGFQQSHVDAYLKAEAELGLA